MWLPGRLTPFGAVYDLRTRVSPVRTPMRSPHVVAGPMDSAAPVDCDVKCNVFVFSRVGRFEPEKQAPVEDVHQLVYAMIAEGELDDLRRFCKP